MKSIKNFSVLMIAMVCHEANKAWCEVNGDKSQKKWDEAEDWQRESAIKGVQFRIENPDAGQDAQHNSWMKEKVEQGWIYGEEKNADLKTHPCIVPFEQLPEFQQKKDSLFCAIVDCFITKEKNETKGLTLEQYTQLRQGEGSFGLALEALKEGKLVCRSGWNGKGMFIVKQIPSVIGTEIIPKMQSLPQSVKDVLVERNQPISYESQMLIINSNGRADSWVPSSSDCFANDWQTFELSQKEI